MAEPNTGMPKADMKRLLSMSKKDPVNCAIGLGPDTSVGLLMLDKNKAPRALEKLLTAAFPGAKNMRWGTAVVDPDTDPKLVKLILNNSVSGMAKKLAKTVKGTGITKVVIALEDGTEVERHAGEEEEEQGEQPAAETAEATAPAPDHGALERQLAGLIPRIKEAAATNPAIMPDLAKIAGAGNAALKAGNLADAAANIEQLASRLDSLSSGGQAQAETPAGGDGAVVRVAKGLLLWNATRGYVDQQVKKLQQAILEQSENEDDFDDIKANLGNLDEVLERLDDRLTVKLDQLRGTTDPQAKAQITAEARQVVTEYQQYVATDELMADIDDNGFIPLDVKAKVTAALEGVLKVI